MNILRNLMVILLLWLPGLTAARQDDSIQALMSQISESMLQLLPMINQKSPDMRVLNTEVGRLNNLFKAAGSHFEKAEITSQLNYFMISEQLALASDYAQENNLYSVKTTLAEAFQLCASCHTLDRHSRRAFGVSRLKDLDEFLAAEYSFLTRDYESALTSYKNYLSNVSDDYYRRALALDRILGITAGVYGDPALTRDTLRSLLPHLSPLSAEQVRVKDWVDVMIRLIRAPDDIQSPTHVKTMSEMDQFLGSEWPATQSALTWNEQQAYWIIIRSSLNQFMQGEPGKDEMPQLLYWLAVSDRSLHYRFYESLSRRYLDRCIRDYPDHAYARKCFDEYELLMIVSYSGSGGINVPVEIQQELNELRAIVYGTPDS